MASRQELLDSIRPDMKLTKNFFMRIYGYEISFPGFADRALTELEKDGCSKARTYYQQFVDEYEKKRDKEMKDVAQWYKKQFGKEGVDNSWKRRKEVELLKEGLHRKSDKELLTLLQKLRAENRLQYVTKGNQDL